MGKRVKCAVCLASQRCLDRRHFENAGPLAVGFCQTEAGFHLLPNLAKSMHMQVVNDNSHEMFDHLDIDPGRKRFVEISMSHVQRSYSEFAKS